MCLCDPNNWIADIDWQLLGMLYLFASITLRHVYKYFVYQLFLKWLWGKIPMERHCSKICREIMAWKIEVLGRRSMHIFMGMLIISATLILKLNSDQRSVPTQMSHIKGRSFYFIYINLTISAYFFCFLCSYKIFE